MRTAFLSMRLFFCCCFFPETLRRVWGSHLGRRYVFCPAQLVHRSGLTSIVALRSHNLLFSPGESARQHERSTCRSSVYKRTLNALSKETLNKKRNLNVSKYFDFCLNGFFSKATLEKRSLISRRTFLTLFKSSCLSTQGTLIKHRHV